MSQSQHIPIYGYYLVAFIDLLGQKDELAKLAILDRGFKDATEIEKVLLVSAKHVQMVRQSLHEIFTQASEIACPSELDSAEAEVFAQAKTISYGQVGFSDSFALSLSLIEDEWGAGKTGVAVHTVLRGLAGIWLSALAHGVPLRGGLQIDVGLNLFQNEVYGPVLVDAYRLESTRAEYPRCIVGDGLERHLNYLDSLPASTASNTLAHKLIPQITSLVCYAPDDDEPMLNFLAPHIWPNEPSFKITAIKAHQWVKTHYAMQVMVGNEKLASRYARLLQYFEAAGFVS